MKKITAFAFALLLLFPFAAPAYAWTGTVDLSAVRQNVRGQGFFWDNINDTLTLSDAALVTESDFGIKLPEGATVVVEGNCRVEAGRYGISCPGSVTFKGTGKITVVGGECGMYFYSTNRDNRILFLDGDYTVSGGECGLRSDGAEVSVCGGRTVFSGPDAIRGIDLSFSGCTSRTEGRTYAAHLITVSGANLSSVAEKGPSLVAVGKLEVSDVKIEAGDAEDRLAAVEKYGDQSAVRFTSTYRRVRTSAVFGEGVPGWVDVALIVAAGAVAAAGIAIPFIRKAIRRKKIRERSGK